MPRKSSSKHLYTPSHLHRHIAGTCYNKLRITAAIHSFDSTYNKRMIPVILFNTGLPGRSLGLQDENFLYYKSSSSLSFSLRTKNISLQICAALDHIPTPPENIKKKKPKKKEVSQQPRQRRGVTAGRLTGTGRQLPPSSTTRIRWPAPPSARAFPAPRCLDARVPVGGRLGRVAGFTWRLWWPFRAIRAIS